MVTIKQKIIFALGLLIGFSNNSFAVFCSMFHYIHPVTGNSVILLSDLHIDIDVNGTITTLQQNALLKAALASHALVIAESPTINHQYGYGLYLTVLLAVYMSQHHKIVKSLIGLEALHTLFEWKRHSPLHKNPPYSLNKYLQTCQQVNPNKEAHYTCYLKSPLINLVACCSNLVIPAIDVEFRYHTTEVFFQQIKMNNPWYKHLIYLPEQTYNWLMRMLTWDYRRYPLTLLDCCRVNNNIIDEILHYKDSPVLDSFYQQCIADYRSSYITKMLSNYALRKKNPFLQTLIPMLSKKSGHTMVTVALDLIEYNFRLLDARLVHEIYTHQQEKNLFVCAGAFHIKNICTAMDELGYQLKKTYGAHNVEELIRSGVLNDRGQLLKLQVKDLDYLVIDLEKIFASDYVF